MFQEISYYLIFGFPLIVHLGIITILMLTITALIALLKRKVNIKISIKWHHRLAYFSIILALLHGIFGLFAYF
jgi:hypothetical protein